MIPDATAHVAAQSMITCRGRNTRRLAHTQRVPLSTSTMSATARTTRSRGKGMPINDQLPEKS